MAVSKKYQRKKRDLKDSSKSGTSAESIAKAQKVFSHCEFMHWLDDFLARRQGKSNLPARDQFKEYGDAQSLLYEENLVIPSDITPTSQSIEEEGENTEPGFTFNTLKTHKNAWKIVLKF